MKNENQKTLPELTGTPKQIAWAETIRAEWIEKAENYRIELTGYIEAEPNGLEEIFGITPENDPNPGRLEKLNLAIGAMKRRTKAKEWIYIEVGITRSQFTPQNLATCIGFDEVEPDQVINDLFY